MSDFLLHSFQYDGHKKQPNLYLYNFSLSHENIENNIKPELKVQTNVFYLLNPLKMLCFNGWDKWKPSKSIVSKVRKRKTFENTSKLICRPSPRSRVNYCFHFNLFPCLKFLDWLHHSKAPCRILWWAHKVRCNRCFKSIPESESLGRVSIRLFEHIGFVVRAKLCTK